MWTWQSEQRAAFNETKKLMAAAPILAHYEPAKPLVITTDASSTGMGAVLSHPHPQGGMDRPIAFASRSFSSAERNYSQLDKEARAVLFGVTKFHQFVYGRPFVVKTDHQPLLGLLSPEKALPHTVSPRLLRWRLQLSGYQYRLQYTPGKQIANADGLSRLPLPEAPSEVPVPGDIVQMLEDVSRSVEVAHIQRATSRDPVLSQVCRFLLTEWPESLPGEEFLPYHRRRTELSLQDGCVLWGCRVIIPPPLRDQVISVLHDGHPGIGQMKRLARSHVWWPQLDATIDTCVRACHQSQVLRARLPEVPPQPWSFPQRPWQRVHVDFAGPVEGRQLLVVVDAYSKWCDVHICSSTSAAVAIEKLRISFSSKGLPAVLVSDNGPAFASAEFQAFMKGNLILHKFSPPLHPASNGQAEAMVKVVKTALAHKAEGSLQTRLSRFLFRYRNTPHSTTGRTPAELLMGRHLRTLLDQLHPDLSAKVVRQQQAWTDRSEQSASDRQFTPGDKVYVTAIPNSEEKWLPAVVTTATGHSCEVRLLDGRLFLRHRTHLRTRLAAPPEAPLASAVPAGRLEPQRPPPPLSVSQPPLPVARSLSPPPDPVSGHLSQDSASSPGLCPPRPPPSAGPRIHRQSLSPDPRLHRPPQSPSLACPSPPPLPGGPASRPSRLRRPPARLDL